MPKEAWHDVIETNLTSCYNMCRTVIPGMRSPTHVRANTAVADGRGLPPDLLAALRDHRWDREPTEWSQ